MSETNKPSAEQLAKFKQRANDMSLSEEARAKFRAIVEKFESAVEDKPAKAPRKPRAPKAEGTTKKAPASKGTGKKSADDIEKAKAEIKRKTGKTEEECESIIEQYRALRTKAQEGKRKAEQASANNKERVGKLERKGDIIEGTNEKTADAVIESTAKDVAEKIEKEVEAVEEKDNSRAVQCFTDGFRWTMASNRRYGVKKYAVLFSTANLVLADAILWIFDSRGCHKESLLGHIDFFSNLIRRNQVQQFVDHPGSGPNP